MLQDSITLKNRHLKFLQTVSDSEIVYGLKSKNGYATSSSTEYEDNHGEPIRIICFWSKEVQAKSCAKNEWRAYKVTEIPLAEFIENWYIGMVNDELLAGTEFDQNLYGYEIEPLDLILELTAELKLNGKDLILKKFEGVSDIEKQVKEIIK